MLTALLSVAKPTPAPSSHTGVFVALLVVIFLLAAGVVTLLLRRPQTGAAARQPDEPAQRQPGADAMTRVAEPDTDLSGHPTDEPGRIRSGDARAAMDQRDILAHTCMDVAEMLENNALAAELQLGLERAGYEIVAPTGVRFNPKIHEAFDRRRTDDPSLDLIVAATIRPGYRLAGQTIRHAKVVVYRVDSPPVRV